MLRKWIVYWMVAAVIGFGLSGIAAPAMAAETKADAQALDDVVVTATRTEQKMVDVPIVTQVINRDDIELSGTIHIGDLLAKYITGHYGKYNGLYQSAGLRGFQTDVSNDINGDVLVLVDGHRIGTGNTAKINMDRIERIEITKGPSSALYGSAAMGGVINLITKKGYGDLKTGLALDYGSFDYYKVTGTSGGEVNDRFRFYLAASHEDFDNYEDRYYGEVYNTDETKTNVGANLTFNLTDTQEIRIGGNYGDLTGGYPKWKDGEKYTSYDEDYAANYDKSHAYADLAYNGEFFDSRFIWKGVVYYLWDHNQWFSGDPDPDSNQTKYIDETIGTDHQFVYKMSDWNQLLVGFNLEYLTKESEGIRNYEPVFPSTPGMEYESKAAFFQDSLDVFDNRVNIIAAGRYDRFDVTTTRPDTGEAQEFNEKSEVYDNFSPKLGAGVKFFDELLRLRANVGEGFHSPGANELSADYISDQGRRYQGNPDLKPETCLTYEAGFDVFHQFGSLQVSYFHSDYEDKIVQEDIGTADEPVITWKNHGEAEIAGVDVNLSWKIGRTFDWPMDLSLWCNTTFNTTKEDKETNEDLLNISDYEVKSGLQFGYGGLGGTLSYTLIGPQMIKNYDSYPYTEEEKDSFEFWDLTLRYRFSEHWEARASILNMFDDYVEWVRGYAMAERNYRVGVTFTF